MWILNSEWSEECISLVLGYRTSKRISGSELDVVGVIGSSFEIFLT